MQKGSPLTLRNYFIQPYGALDTLLSTIINSWYNGSKYNLICDLICKNLEQSRKVKYSV